MQNQILCKTTAKITNEQKNLCDDMINLNELEYSTQQLPLGKSRIRRTSSRILQDFLAYNKTRFFKVTGEVHRLNLLPDS